MAKRALGTVGSARSVTAYVERRVARLAEGLIRASAIGSDAATGSRGADTSVLLRLFVAHDDELQAAVPEIERAWRSDRLQLVLLDLSVYELVNVAVRRLGFDAPRARQAVGEVYGLGAPVVAVDHQLAMDGRRSRWSPGSVVTTAVFVAAARRVGVALLTADRRSPSSTARSRWGLCSPEPARRTAAVDRDSNQLAGLSRVLEPDCAVHHRSDTSGGSWLEPVPWYTS